MLVGTEKSQNKGGRTHRWKWAVSLAFFLCASSLLCWRSLPKPDLFAPSFALSRVVLDRTGNVIHVTLTPDGKYRLPVRFADLSPEILRATLEMEDRRFFSHHGVDPKSILRAIWGLMSNQRLGGGSTLTMQYARLRWGIDTRTLRGKALQMFRASQLERFYSKEQILEAYFTCAPYGGNIEGISAASMRWCGKTPRELSLREAASLSVIPQSPTRRRPKFAGNPALVTAQVRLMNRLRATRGEPPDALDTEFQLSPVPIPRQAPHFAIRQLREHPNELVLKTTLDSVQQRTLEQSITDFLARSHVQNLRNGAALLLHAPTGEVRAYVGSADFWNNQISGQIDGVRARRSPGSSLKPFIYALALDAGLIHPRTLLDDAPSRFGEYNPENSDRDFLGPISARDALRKSRNIPAIALSQKLPGNGLEGFLRQAGVKLPRQDYGLALAIGAAEISMEELVTLYRGLTYGNLGLSPAACWLTLDALRTREPLAPSGLTWKTGTSNGFRDAWATGVCGEWVLSVWLGNFDGKPMPNLFARKTAAPLLWQTATRLKLRTTGTPRPSTISEVHICAASGDLAGPFCSHLATDFFIPGTSPITTCTVHREIFVDNDGHRVCANDDSAIRRVGEFWSPQRLAQFQRAGSPRTGAPTLEQNDMASLVLGRPPRITSPQSALRYVVRLQDPAKSAIPLEADVAPGINQIHWFAGSSYLGASEPTKPLLWKPSAGDWTIQAVDEAGRATRTNIRVNVIP
ncbi:MAG: penicillin-binding protein 1C [Verrucomicrobiota bacterium]